MKVIIVSSLLTFTIITGCAQLARKGVQPVSNIPYISFVKYDRPEKVSMQVYIECEQYGMKIGDCVKISDVKKLVARAKILDAIIDNYEKDIDAYNRLMGRSTGRTKNISEVLSE